MSRPVRIGLLGFGTVGTGLLKILQSRPRQIAARAGVPVEVRWICDLNLRPRAGVRVSRRQLTRNAGRVLRDPEVDIIVELIGGYEPARSFILSAIENGKHVVTANKAVLARHWNEVMGAARRRGVLVYFEASVGGGIPVIQALNEGLAANRISSILGILNGTTNYILTRMSRDGLEFGEALRRAQRLGFAEADPSFDINGMDAAHKIAILGSIAFGGQVPLRQVHTEGIRRITRYDIQCGRERFGFGLKLLAAARHESAAGRLSVRVHPAFIPSHHPLNACADEFNAITITGDAAGQTMFYGRGAGQMAAASAAASDLIFLARRIASSTVGDAPYVSFDPRVRLRILPMEEHRCEFYLRFSALDRPGVLSRLSGILGRNGVSIASCVQEAPASGLSRYATLVMITHRAREGSLRAALRRMEGLAALRERPLAIRIERPE